MTLRFALFAVLVAFSTLPGSAATQTSAIQYGLGNSTAQGDTAQIAPIGNEVPRSARMPMYDAFKKFCIATAAQPVAIEKAVTTSGITFHKRGPASTANPWPMDTIAWDMDFQGHKLTLNAGNAMEPSGAGMIRKTDNCTITSWNNADEKASIAALHRWAGIGRSADRPLRRGGTLTLYAFEIRDGAMVPLRDDDAGRLAKAEGRTWQLTITDNSAMLTHNFSPSPRP